MTPISDSDRRQADTLVCKNPPQNGFMLVRAHLSKGDLFGFDPVAAFLSMGDAEEYCRLMQIELQCFGGWPDWDSYEIWPIRDGRVVERG